MSSRAAASGFGALVALGLIATVAGVAPAADHREYTTATNDPAADIDDVYAWHNTTFGTFTAVITFAGGAAPDVAKRTSPIYDKDVLYTLHVDTTGDDTPERNIYIRFGQNNVGDWGLQVQNMPGTTAAVVGKVNETVTVAGNPKLKVRAGLFDDPFFFDLEGFRSTLQSGTLSFSNTRDSFAEQNVMAIVLECDLAAMNTGTKLKVWASTGRK